MRSDHLHLEYRNGLENPLKYVLHKDDNDPVAVLWPKFKYVGADGLASDLTGDSIYNNPYQPLILQAGVDVTGEKDLDKVGIYVTPEGSLQSAVWNAWSYEPATTPHNFVNSTRVSAGKIHLKNGIAEIAGAAEEGVYPKRGEVSFDFFKFNWDTRAPNASAPFGYWYAPINDMALYPDGIYTILMGAKDITDHEVGTETVKTLDNFRPYVIDSRISNGYVDCYGHGSSDA